MVPYVNAVVVVCGVCLLKECAGARLTATLMLGVDEVW